MYLEQINNANDVKQLDEDALMPLAAEIREFLIDRLSETGGHLASNLGVVELTIALHRCLDFPKDKLIWDVGHQSYTHKILTGRRDEFATLRSFGGLSGFPKRAESETDAFDTGHSSTSISAGLGFAYARDLSSGDERIVSVIGDGALTGGLAFEALNNVPSLKKNFVVILNDNNMSISENVGSLAVQLSKMRTSVRYAGLKEGVHQSLEKIPFIGEKIDATIHRTKSGIKQLVIPGMLFEEMGLLYLGPVDGHNIPAMERIFEEAFAYQGPVLVHVLTKKGRGFLPAERHPSRFHGAEPFDKESGLPLKHKEPTYTDIFATVIRKAGERDERIVAITAAMMDGTGLKRFRNRFPERFVDVGLAEEHAVTFSAALALSGLRPVVVVYSSFLQRAYDEMLHDVCLQKLPVIFCIDRAGLVGADGDTHQGIFDLSYLYSMPNMTVLAPKNKWELSDMVKYALAYKRGPVAIRYPKGEAYTGLEKHRKRIAYGKAEVIEAEGDVLLFALGSMVQTAVEVWEKLRKKGIVCAIVNVRFAKPLDRKYLNEAAGRYKMIVTMEENVLSGGFGEHINTLLMEEGFGGKILNIAIPDQFVPHGDIDILKKKCGIDAGSVARKIKKAYQ